MCDQLSQVSSEPMFGPDDHEFARSYTAMQAVQLARMNVLDERVFEPNVKSWSMRMSQNSEYVDNIFLLVFALVQERDIVVIPVHRDTAAGSLFE